MGQRQTTRHRHRAQSLLGIDCSGCSGLHCWNDGRRYQGTGDADAVVTVFSIGRFEAGKQMDEQQRCDWLETVNDSVLVM